jgi:aerobic carbon-monoxide dehydrogenase medium subunit
MYPKAFEYMCPGTVEEAIALLSEYGESARVLAGGQSLVPLMKLRMSSLQYLIDINRIADLAYIREREGTLFFGALTRHATIEDSALVKSKLRIVHDTACVIGDAQVRNLGTIGGSLAHADPAGDWAPTLLALNARVQCRGPHGERSLTVDELLADAYTTTLNKDEILTEIAVPLPGPNSGGAYLKFERKAGDFAVASVAVQMTIGPDEICRDIGVGLGAVALTAIKARQAEALLRGEKLTDALVASAAQEASRESDPFPDLRGPVEYKRQLVKVLFVRAVHAAVRRARGEELEVAHV